MKDKSIHTARVQQKTAPLGFWNGHLKTMRRRNKHEAVLTNTHTSRYFLTWCSPPELQSTHINQPPASQHGHVLAGGVRRLNKTQLKKKEKIFTWYSLGQKVETASSAFSHSFPEDSYRNKQKQIKSRHTSLSCNVGLPVTVVTFHIGLASGPLFTWK